MLQLLQMEWHSSLVFGSKPLKPKQKHTLNHIQKKNLFLFLFFFILAFNGLCSIQFLRQNGNLLTVFVSSSYVPNAVDGRTSFSSSSSFFFLMFLFCFLFISSNQSQKWTTVRVEMWTFENSKKGGFLPSCRNGISDN